MKNAEIHTGLEDREVRDFLAFKERDTGWKSGTFYNAEYYRQKIREFEELLKLAEQSEAVQKLLELNGWTSFDVSELIQDYSQDGYFNFIGTEKEFKQFLSELE